MDPPPDPINEDDQEDIVFFDALDDSPIDHDSSESSSSTIIDPQPISDDSVHPHHSTDNLRRRPSRHVSLGRKNSSFGCEGDLINKARLSSNKQVSFENPTNLDEIVNEECDTIQEQDESSTVTNELREEKDKESAFTSAPENGDAIDGTAEDDSGAEMGISGSNFLESIAGLLIKTIEFQIHLFVMFTTYPFWFLFHSCMFFINPLRTVRMGKRYLKGILSRVWDGFCGWVGLPIHGILGNGKPIGNLALRYGWGLLWAIYVCFVLVSLMGSSLVISGYIMKIFVEKPIHMREALNFDYTKQTPVAYVPLMSCPSIDHGVDSENNIGAGNLMKTRIIPPRHKVQVIVSLLVPESEYNRHLGIFQVRVEFLSLNGKTIASSSQPAMLRFKSEPIRLVWTFLKMAPVLTGHISETQTLNVKIRGFIEKNDFPTSCLKVTLEHRAEYRAGAGIPEIYDAHLILESELPFLKRILWQWKMSIFIWITMVSFIFEVLLLLLCCTPIIFPRIRRRGGSSSRPNTHDNPVAGSG